MLAPASPAQVRTLDPPESEALDDLLRRYGVDPGSDWKKGRKLRLVARDDLEPRRRVVLVGESVMEVVAPFDPHTVGLPVAQLGRKGARLTLEGACWIAPAAKNRVVTVSPKGETLFLYGRTLLSRSVKRVAGPVESGDEVLVVRASDGRCIGIGIAQEALLRRGRGSLDEVAVTNRLDLGRYLRDAQKVVE